MFLIGNFMFLTENFMFLIENFLSLIENFIFLSRKFHVFDNKFHVLIANFEILIGILMQLMQNTTRWSFLHQLYFCAAPFVSVNWCKFASIFLDQWHSKYAQQPWKGSEVSQASRTGHFIKGKLVYKEILWQLWSNKSSSVKA